MIDRGGVAGGHLGDVDTDPECVGVDRVGGVVIEHAPERAPHDQIQALAQVFGQRVRVLVPVG